MNDRKSSGIFAIILKISTNSKSKPSEQTSFYSVEQDVFDVAYPFLLGVEEMSN
jgi:hypothetical protein